MANIGRVRVVFAGFGGGPGMATHFFHLDTAWQWAGYKQNAIDGVASAYDEIRGLFTSTISYTVQPEVDVIDDATGDLVATYVGTASTDVGTATGGIGPMASGLCATWRTDGIVNSKHVRGRTFLVPVDITMAEGDGTPTAAALALVASYGDTLIHSLAPYGDLVIWSRPAPSRPGSSYFVTSCTVSDKFAVLRSRRD